MKVVTLVNCQIQEAVLSPFLFDLSGAFDSMTLSLFNGTVLSRSWLLCSHCVLRILSLSTVISFYGLHDATYLVVAASSMSLSLICSHDLVNLLSYLIINISFLFTF